MTEADYAEFRRDHEAIDLLARRLSSLVAEKGRPDDLSLALDHLLRMVADHLAREDAAIYELAMRAQPGFSEDSARIAREDFERLKANWSDYLKAWSADEIAADLEGFVRATQAILPRLHNRVRLESDLLVALALANSASGGGAAASY